LVGFWSPSIRIRRPVRAEHADRRVPVRLRWPTRSFC